MKEQTVNDRVKIVRKLMNLNQDDFGISLAVTAPAISKIESGKCAVTEHIFQSICRVFRVDATWLRTGEGGDEAIFTEYDDKNLENLQDEYQLDYMTLEIIKAYIKAPEVQRRAIYDFIESMASTVLKDTIDGIHIDICNDIFQRTTGFYEEIKDELIEIVDNCFNKAFPHERTGPAHQVPGVYDQLDDSLVDYKIEAEIRQQNIDRQDTVKAQECINRQKKYDETLNKKGKKEKLSS